MAEEMAESAEAAFRLVVSFVQDEDLPAELRLQAAKEVMSRAWGKPKQEVALSGPEEPAIDADAVRRALADPRALELACELDKIVSRPAVDPVAN